MRATEWLRSLLFVLLGAVVATIGGCSLASAGGDVVHAAEGGVRLLEHPFPYQASLSVLSDLHATTVEEFEAVHTLINTREEIVAGSLHWRTLNWDAVLGQSAPPSVRGFGFPFSDAFFVFAKRFGVFRTFDESTGRLVPHSPRDLSPLFVEWHRKGYIDALHTFGTGRLTRREMAAAAAWMHDNLSRPVRVHVNHSKASTPVGLGGPCCTLLNQILVSLRYRAYRALGIEGRLRPPKPLPHGREPLGYALLASSGVMGLAILAAVRTRRLSVPWLGLLAVLTAVPLLSMQLTPIEFHEGDNPSSPLYNLDLVRSVGVRFFWLGDTDLERSTLAQLPMPTSIAQSGRPTIFSIHEFDDGSRGLTFMRSTIGGGASTLGLLSGDSLDRFVAAHGHSVLYLHWLSRPTSYFNAEGLARLSTLRAYADTRRVWLASATALLTHAYAYAYLAFDTQVQGTHAMVTIKGFDDPIHGRLEATVSDLASLSFACDGAESLSIILNDTPLGPDALRVEREGRSLVGTIVAPPQTEAGH